GWVQYVNGLTLKDGPPWDGYSDGDQFHPFREAAVNLRYLGLDVGPNYPVTLSLQKTTPHDRLDAGIDDASPTFLGGMYPGSEPDERAWTHRYFQNNGSAPLPVQVTYSLP